MSVHLNGEWSTEWLPCGICASKIMTRVEECIVIPKDGGMFAN
jgi:hypothetical protein